VKIPRDSRVRKGTHEVVVSVALLTKGCFGEGKKKDQIRRVGKIELWRRRS